LNDTKIWGLGLGPGDPDLITVKSLKILQQVDVIAYPAPLEGDSLTRTIAAPHLRGDQAEIAIRVPMVEERYPAQEIYDGAALEIADHVRQGKSVAILCEGDPFFYGSFMYLFSRLAEEFEIDVVPGVSSLAASAAGLGMPLSERNEVVTVIPAPLDEAEIEARLNATEVAAIMKVGRHFKKVKRVLDRLGLTAHAGYIERATMKEQRILDLTEMADDEAIYFSMIIVRRDGGDQR